VGKSLAYLKLLFSGDKIKIANARWLIEGHDRAQRLGRQPLGDAPAALLVLRNDLKALAVLAVQAWRKPSSEANTSPI
jgi:hypothetical protein